MTSNPIICKCGKVAPGSACLTSGTITKRAMARAMTMFTQSSHRRNVKYEATTDPKCDSISFMRDSHGINWVEKFVNSRRMCCIF